MAQEAFDESGGRGTIHVSWASCPNRECPSRLWDIWDIDYEEDRFECGTCGEKLMRPIFLSQASVREQICPYCLSKRG